MSAISIKGSETSSAHVFSVTQLLYGYIDTLRYTESNVELTKKTSASTTMTDFNYLEYKKNVKIQFSHSYRCNDTDSHVFYHFNWWCMDCILWDFFPPFCIIYIGTQSYLSQKSFEALQSHGRVLSTLSRKQEQSINNGQQCSEKDIANITNQLKI